MVTSPCKQSVLHAQYRREDASEDVVPRLSHRLDVETSGVLVLSTEKKLASRMAKQFQQRVVDKTYLAIVDGVPLEKEGTIDIPLTKSLDPTSTFYVQYKDEQNGKACTTKYRVLSELQGGKYCLVAFSPVTGNVTTLRHHQFSWKGIVSLDTSSTGLLCLGRTHQIRAHAQLIGHPLVGDVKYNARVRESSSSRERLALHCCTLRFQHPATFEVIEPFACIDDTFPILTEAERDHFNAMVQQGIDWS
eukprot:m.223574 g.223574  ORF g.223574 m.223574 type:complete len:248 (-) comp15140_c1_seq11:1511-2254(-)